ERLFIDSRLLLAFALLLRGGCGAVVGEAAGVADVFADLIGAGVAEVFAGFFGDLSQVLDDVGVLGGDVGGFADVVFEVEQFLADFADLVLPGHAAVAGGIGVAVVVRQMHLPVAA